MEVDRSFCHLETDKKTYEYFLKYYHAIRDNSLAWHLDNEIQGEEIADHLKRHPDCNNKIEKLNWIDNNSLNFRSYLNSIKIIALFSNFMVKMKNVNEDEQEKIDWKSFAKIVEMWNHHKMIIIDSIFI